MEMYQNYPEGDLDQSKLRKTKNPIFCILSMFQYFAFLEAFREIFGVKTILGPFNW